MHSGGNVGGAEPQLDLPFGITRIGRGVDQVVHAIPQHLALGILDLLDGAERSNAARTRVASHMRIGGAGNLAHLGNGLGSLVHDGDHAATPGIVRVVQLALDVLE